MPLATPLGAQALGATNNAQKFGSTAPYFGAGPQPARKATAAGPSPYFQGSPYGTNEPLGGTPMSALTQYLINAPKVGAQVIQNPQKYVQPSQAQIAYGQGVTQANNARDYYSAMYAPQLIGLQQQAADLANQQGLAGTKYRGDKAYAQQDYGLNSQLLQLQRERDIGQRNADLGALNTYLDKVFGIKTAGLHNDLSYLTDQGKFADLAKQQALDYIAQQRGLAGQAFEQAAGNAYNQYNTGVRDVYGNGASGAFGTPQSTVKGDLETQRAQAESAARLQQQGALTDLANREGETNLANTRTHVDLANQANQLNRGYDEYKAGYEKDKAGAQAQAQLISSLSQEYGLRQDQLKAAMENSLRGMGLDYEQTMAQLTNATNSNNAQQVAAAQAITQQILANASMFPTTRATGAGVSTTGKTPLRGNF